MPAQSISFVIERGTIWISLTPVNFPLAANALTISHISAYSSKSLLTGLPSTSTNPLLRP